MQLDETTLLNALKAIGKPVYEDEFFGFLNLEPTDGANYLDLIEALEKSGELFRTKRGKLALPISMDLILGKISVTSKGFGFIMPNDSSLNDIFIAPNDLNGAMHGDTVYGKITGKKHGEDRVEGKVIRILNRANAQIVGTLDHRQTFGFVIPDNHRLNRDIYIPEAGLLDAKDNDKVVVKITKWAEGDRNPVGKIIEVLGHSGDPDVDIIAVIRKYQLPEDFPHKVIKEASRIGDAIDPTAIAGRRDLRDELIITIDGADAKDLDDAVSVKKLDNGNYKLGVHIADVTHYVTEGSKLDKEAIKRGTSVYLIDRVIPMLPPALSNGICSLNPDVDRLAMSCDMEIDTNGVVVNYELYTSVIRSKYRLTYTAVSDILEGKSTAETEKYQAIIPMFKAMEQLCLILKHKRVKRGAIDFDFAEPYIELDSSGKPLGIKARERRIANRIIEEFMLVANETVAEHVFWLELPFVYRIHENPSPDKIAEFNKFIYKFGYKLKGSGDDFHPKEMQRLLGEVSDKKEKPIVHKLMLRSLKQAKYSPICEGHFGLAAKYYSHFTSPIRRYPDLQIHRILKEIIEGDLDKKRIEHLKKTVDKISVSSSERERVAEKAERETDDIKKAEYMEQFVGQTFEGMISSVTSFGVFVELDNTIEGLVPLSSMEDDYYHFDEKKLMVVGENTKNIYTIGDRVKILVERVEVSQRQIDFEIIEKLED